jgi:hypothetical protein
MTRVVHHVRSSVSAAVKTITAGLAGWLERVAEQRMRQARFEAEMYRGAYRPTTKNDDELPIAR